MCHSWGICSCPRGAPVVFRATWRAPQGVPRCRRREQRGGERCRSEPARRDDRARRGGAAARAPRCARVRALGQRPDRADAGGIPLVGPAADRGPCADRPRGRGGPQEGHRSLDPGARRRVGDDEGAPPRGSLEALGAALHRHAGPARGPTWASCSRTTRRPRRSDAEPREGGQLAAPRLCTLTEDEHANVLDCDEAFTQMCGFTREDVVGGSVLDQIHPDDQARAVESWLQMLATKRDQHYRGRRKHKDGHWLWVDTTLHHLLDRPESRPRARRADRRLRGDGRAGGAAGARGAAAPADGRDAGGPGAARRRGRVVYHNAHAARDLPWQARPCGGGAREARRAAPSTARCRVALATPVPRRARGALRDGHRAAAWRTSAEALAEVLERRAATAISRSTSTFPPGEWRRVLLTSARCGARAARWSA